MLKYSGVNGHVICNVFQMVQQYTCSYIDLSIYIHACIYMSIANRTKYRLLAIIESIRRAYVTL